MPAPEDRRSDNKSVKYCPMVVEVVMFLRKLNDYSAI